MKKSDLSGSRFGKLTVLKDSGERTKNGTVIWECRCDCGTITHVAANNLKSKTHPTVSCGCERRKRFLKEGYTLLDKRLYSIFSGMKERCYNPSHPHFKNYGGKGVSICHEWLSNYTAFYDWAKANGYSDNLTIDRIDNSKGYSPENCRWIPLSQQSKNRSSCVRITYGGETHCIAEWARIAGVQDGTFRARLRAGWSIEKALEKRG